MGRTAYKQTGQLALKIIRQERPVWYSIVQAFEQQRGLCGQAEHLPTGFDQVAVVRIQQGAPTQSHHARGGCKQRL